MSAGAGVPQWACAAALAGLPHMTPVRLRLLLGLGRPEQAWAAVQAGAVMAGAVRARTGAGAGAGAGEAGDPIEGPIHARRPHPIVQAEPTQIGRGPAGIVPPRLDLGRLAPLWAAAAKAVDLVQLQEAYMEAGAEVWWQPGPDYPEVLAQDPQPPAVLFAAGSRAALGRPRVAIVGTRSATHYGQEVAAELGLGLARAGVSVVSGLAIGIDAAAHTGALAAAAAAAPPLAVVASGLDVVYPPSHRALWARLAAAGTILSESPLGARPARWRFPWRNRLIAALADVVVVVESHREGGSLLTVEAAARRGVTVLAVPGSVRSPASEGTNALLADGCAPARDVEDVLVALALRHPGWEHGPKAGRAGPGAGAGGGTAIGGPHPAGTGGAGAGAALAGAHAEVWRALDPQPTTTETVLRRTGLTLGQVGAALDGLEQEGWARRGDGWWEKRWGRE